MRYLYLGLLFIALGLSVPPLPAQTAIIQYKSHSGSSSNFTAAHSSFDHYDSNFGIAPQRIVETARLDSVIYLNDSLAVMITTEECRRATSPGRSREELTVWRAGRDTVHHHPLFQHQHQLDHIRTVLDRDYYFVNPASETVFIGYDNVSVPPNSGTEDQPQPNHNGNYQNGQKPPSSTKPNGQGQQSGQRQSPRAQPQKGNGQGQGGQVQATPAQTGSTVVEEVAVEEESALPAELTEVKRPTTSNSSQAGWWMIGLLVVVLGGARWWRWSTVEAQS